VDLRALVEDLVGVFMCSSKIVLAMPTDPDEPPMCLVSGQHFAELIPDEPFLRLLVCSGIVLDGI